MTDRVILGALPGGGYGLRVSRPGFDATNAALEPKQVAFDSRWAASSRIFLRGAIALADSFGTSTISFGVTFSSPPPVIGMFRYRGNGQWVSAESANESIISITVPDITNIIEEYLEPTYDFSPFEVYTNRIVVNRRPGPNWYDRFSYIVLRT